MQHYFCPHEKKMVKKALLLSNISTYSNKGDKLNL